MRLAGVLFILFCLFSCKKETSDPPIVVEEEKYFVVGNDSGSINFKIISNPIPEVDSFYQGSMVKEFYWLELPGHEVIRITRWEGHAPFSSSLSRYDNLIRIEGTEHVLAEGVSEEFTISESRLEDSVFALSENSLLQAFPRIHDQYTHTNYYPIPFEPGDSIAISKEDPQWRKWNHMNVAEHIQGFTFYYHQLHERLTTYPDSTTKYSVTDDYYPAWAGLNEKYLVFNYGFDSNFSDKPENIKIGWVKVSVGLDGSLVVHEVAHQVE